MSTEETKRLTGAGCGGCGGCGGGADANAETTNESTNSCTISEDSALGLANSFAAITQDLGEVTITGISTMDSIMTDITDCGQNDIERSDFTALPQGHFNP